MEYKTNWKVSIGSLFAAAFVVVASSALAQKSKDTVRMAISEPLPTLSQYHFAHLEGTNFQRLVYDQLIYRDEYNHKFVPVLAKSWTRVNDRTLDFELRDDIVFHNGNKFDADDVVATIEYLIDPAVRLRQKLRWEWIKQVQKLGPHKVRIEAFEPNVMDFGLIAAMIPIWDSEIFAKLADKADYGRVSPIGTGPYKVTEFDINKGITVERFDGFKGDKDFFPAPVRIIKGIPIPDRQTQVAQLISGNLELLRSVSGDTAKELAKDKNLAITSVPTGYFLYMMFDAVGRSPNKALTDLRVRQAIASAIDRDSIIKHILAGGDTGASFKMASLCFDYNIACKVNNQPPAYDPSRAKKLLADAGQANGFDLEFTCVTVVKDICEAVAGDLRKVGVRATVKLATAGVFGKLRDDGELQVAMSEYPTTILPDTGNTLSAFFDVGGRDYYRDQQMFDWVAQGFKEMDVQKRAAIYGQIMDRNNDQVYVLPFSSEALTYAHTKDLEIVRNKLSAGDTYINNYRWK